ncbi:hypothetical protein [uncultured Winogradskyella sp.]|uniref:hypothetical protein n=1 Tax=Winogradskyella sp. 4-2091 TaxID=3381659 RepID=UPI002622A2FE|nr:hypothetical protein [uncultured Winogradskyella sp.]
MDEFINEYYNLITRGVEFLAAFTGILVFKKYKHTPTKTIIYFLIYAFWVDFIGSYPSFLYKNDLFYLIEGTLIQRNYWWFTIFWWIGLSVFVSYINYQIIENNRLKKIIKYSFYLYIVQILLSIAFRFEYLFTPNEQFIKIASFWMVSLSIIVYYFELLGSDRIIQFYKSVYFYFNSALFCWILIMIPMDFFEKYFVPEDVAYIMLKYKIYLSLNIFLYLTFTTALIFCKPQTR